MDGVADAPTTDERAVVVLAQASEAR